MPTTQAAKETAEEIADRLAEAEGVENAVVDDCGRSNNFQIALRLPHGKALRDNYHIDTNFRSLTPRIKSVVSDFDAVELDSRYDGNGIENPSMQYEHCRFTGCNQLGYDRPYTLVHIRIFK